MLKYSTYNKKINIGSPNCPISLPPARGALHANSYDKKKLHTEKCTLYGCDSSKQAAGCRSACQVSYEKHKKYTNALQSPVKQENNCQDDTRQAHLAQHY